MDDKPTAPMQPFDYRGHLIVVTPAGHTYVFGKPQYRQKSRPLMFSTPDGFTKAARLVDKMLPPKGAHS